MSLTKSGKNDFSIWTKQMFIENKAEIEAARTDVAFDVDANVLVLGKKETAYNDEIGKVTAIEHAKMDQVKLANVKLDDFYLASSSAIDSLSGYLGKNHTLSILIHKKRESMSNPKNRGPRKPKA